MSIDYLKNKVKIINKCLNGYSLEDLSNNELTKILFSAEQLSQAVRQILSGREIFYPDYGYIENDLLPKVTYNEGVLEIVIPPTVKRQGNESWYLASMVRKGLQKFEGQVSIQSPYFLICERIVPDNRTVIQDNDNLEVHRIINECMKFLGSTDHPLKVGYMSVARIEKGMHLSRILIMSKDNCSNNIFQIINT